MKVYPLPPQLLNSPYLDQLYAPMPALGVDVRRVGPRRSLPALLAGSGPRLLHLHFFDELTQRPGRAHSAARTLGFLGAVAALKTRGVRVIWTAHNLEPHETHHAHWAFLAYRAVARLADGVIAHSAAARRMLNDRYGPLPRAEVIPHGSYIGLYGPRRGRGESRAALGLPAEGPLILSVGTLRPYKNLEGLIVAFGELPAHRRGTLLIAGQAKLPEYAGVLQQTAAGVPGVEIRPVFVPDEALPRYLAAADAVVLPYRTMLTSGILLWALSYARPVVAPAFGPVRELVGEGRQGFLFAPGDRASLRAALARALSHPDLDALGEAGLRVAEHFSWPEIAARTAALYREIVGA